MQTPETFEITNMTRQKAPDVPFLRAKEMVLGENYDLSLVFVGKRRSRTLNQKYRGKDKPANVLSFSLSDEVGEIFVDLGVARKQAPSYGRAYPEFVLFLVIHGMWHLKGYAHGGRMEEAEENTLRQLGVNPF